MSELTETDSPRGEEAAPRIFDRRSLTYSRSFETPMKRNVIRVIEWMTGRIQIFRRIRTFEKLGVPEDHAFWRQAMEVMGVDILTPPEQLARIPSSGPVIVVANHPHGMVDGMVMADLLGRVRSDYRILTRSLLTGISDGAAKYLIPVPFPHESDAQRQMIEMRRRAMAHLAGGGLIALFPAGGVAQSQSFFGPGIEGEWSAFTAKLIRSSGATVVPCHFPGSNTRLYHMAHQVSATLRQALLLREVVRAFDKPQSPVIGHPFDPEDIAARADDPRALMAWLRERTLALRN